MATKSVKPVTAFDDLDKEFPKVDLKIEERLVPLGGYNTSTPADIRRTIMDCLERDGSTELELEDALYVPGVIGSIVKSIRNIIGTVNALSLLERGFLGATDELIAISQHGDFVQVVISNKYGELVLHNYRINMDGVLIKQ